MLEIEESSILDLANTVKVRVIDNDETFAIDEVCVLPHHTNGIFAHCDSISSRSSTRDKTHSTFYAS